jgi:cysteine synthase B
VELYAKAEYFNPGGSVKDRPALNMILEGEASGKLAPGKILLDATSGNTGIAYAMIGAIKGIRVRLAMPENVTPERKRILAAYGAELVQTSGREGSDGAIRMAKKLYAENPELYFYPDQYGNPANWQAHYKSTAVEIFEQTDGRISHFVAGLGTSGTFVGTSRRLRELNPAIPARLHAARFSDAWAGGDEAHGNVHCSANLRRRLGARAGGRSIPKRLKRWFYGWLAKKDCW